jgi:hypothetical protein
MDPDDAPFEPMINTELVVQLAEFYALQLLWALSQLPDELRSLDHKWGLRELGSLTDVKGSPQRLAIAFLRPSGWPPLDTFSDESNGHYIH